MIDRGNKLPVYIQITEWITKNIKEGIWVPHYKLPSEEDLAKQLGVARGTVRQALSELADQGILYRLHGKGTFVAPEQIEHNVDAGKFLTFIEEFVEKRIPFSTEVLEQSIRTPSHVVASYLDLLSTDQVFTLKRLRRVGSSSIMLIENNVSKNMFPGIESYDFSKSTLYSIIEGNYSKKIGWARRLFEAKSAEDEVATLLDVPVGTPIIFVEQIVYDEDGQCVDCAFLWLRSDKMRLSVTLTRNKFEN